MLGFEDCRIESHLGHKVCLFFLLYMLFTISLLELQCVLLKYIMTSSSPTGIGILLFYNGISILLVLTTLKENILECLCRKEIGGSPTGIATTATWPAKVV